MSKLTLLVGNIASFKSTYCKELLKETEALIVNDDSIVNAIHIYNTGYSEDLKPLYKQIENTIIVMGSMLGYNIIVDRPNLTKATRSRYLSLAKSLDMDTEIIVFFQESPEIHASRRHTNNSRGYSYDKWLSVAKRNKEKYEKPTNDECENIIFMK